MQLICTPEKLEPHNDNDNPEDVMHQTNIENLDVHVSNHPQQYLGNLAQTIRRKNAILRETVKNMAENKSKQMNDAEYEKEPNWPEIQISLANAANKKDLEKGTKA
ncbi:18013_t:CDS:2 [Acaulospora morrowiae]|uniref:18013_t:CDS:1 n=1 Tax=Acaulospora morrowiae TaxID=94023 RepID=A0A9N8VKC0_9GLOM|nr:18013_t:CDS:2 [Acaulospora morrowiae]